MTFGEAIEALKVGDRVSRKGWNGKCMWLLLVPGTKDSKVEPGRPLMLAGMPVGTVFDYSAHIDIWTTRGSLVPWTASQTDMLAEDWFVVEATHSCEPAAA